MNIGSLLESAARDWPEHLAFELPDAGSVSYAELDRLAADVASRLRGLSVEPGERVAVCLPKSIDSVAAILGVLRAGCAYVPLGLDTPVSRMAFVLGDCDVRAAFVPESLKTRLLDEWDASASHVIPIGDASDGRGLRTALSTLPGAAETGVTERAADDIAYILYTSGSTGVPKGVTISHGNAFAFIEWCRDVFEPRETDRFSSHAPFHFDLSILDLYAPMTGGAASILISERVSKDPKALVDFVGRERITSWYSTPSVLGLMARFGGADGRDLSSLRTVLFAGEVMAIENLRLWKELAPEAVFYNLYGPTETNVCTYLRIPDTISEDRAIPYPIGEACAHYDIAVVDAEDRPVAAGVEGELVASGPGVMQGYWNRPDLDASAFFEDEHGRRWYRTGDLVVDDGTGVFDFRGRRDRMVKRRGYRVELDEIEVALHSHADVVEVAVVAVDDPEDGVGLHAFVTTASGEPISMIALKAYCLERIPACMVPDRFVFTEALPKTRTDKVDYVRLRELAAA